MKRTKFIKNIEELFDVTPIVAILGPRQCGKTTLANDFSIIQEQRSTKVYFFDLEDQLDLDRLENPGLSLEPLSGLIVIDEIQRRPDLFPALRVIIDKNKDRQKYLILGSASKELIKQSSETLSGRVSYLELTPFNLSEVRDSKLVWYRGGYPLSYLAKNEDISYKWRESYIRTFLEQDIPALGFKISSNELRKFWTMLAHYHGQIFNASEIGRSIGVSNNTAQKYLDILSGTFMVRVLKPWHENIKKRQVKSPKIYFRDSGIFHAILRIIDMEHLYTVPQLGSSWEGFALEEVIRKLSPKIDAYDCYFWSTQSGAELDLLVVLGNKKIGFEFKHQDSPKITKSMRISIENLNLDVLYVVYPGERQYQMDEKIYLINLNYEIQL